MKKAAFVLLVSIGLSGMASAKTPDDRFCGISLKDDAGQDQLLLFKLGKREVIDDVLKKRVEAEEGVTLTCGLSMREKYEAISQQEMMEASLRSRRMIPNFNRPMYRPPILPGLPK